MQGYRVTQRGTEALEGWRGKMASYQSNFPSSFDDVILSNDENFLNLKFFPRNLAETWPRVYESVTLSLPRTTDN